jgi:hypothetical protein
VSAQGHLTAPAEPDLPLGRGQQPGTKSATAMITAHPEELDVAAATPGPPAQAGQQLAVLRANGQAQHSAVVMAGSGHVEGIDLLVEHRSEFVVGISDQQR